MIDIQIDERDARTAALRELARATALVRRA